MFKDDDDDDDSAIGAVRYPVMPSLVALQQMRNRLHLAYLGKKLMKWTALATGKELRRLAAEMNTTLQNYAEDTRTAFMLLARARYFIPNVNDVVLENISTQASVVVGASTKSISGVKILHLNVVESGRDPYPHLGIGKGGRAIYDAKQAWLNLLRLMITMLQLRTTFIQVEIANKNATKRENVLKKILIPKIKATIIFILVELEELAREELYRIKKVKKNKLKMGQPQEDIEFKLPEPKEIVVENEVCVICGHVLKPYVKVEKEAPELFPDAVLESKLEQLWKQLEEIIVLGKNFLDTGVSGFDFKLFVKYCEDVKNKIQDTLLTRTSLDNLKIRIHHLRSHLREAIETTKDIRDEGFVSPTVECFGHTCANIEKCLSETVCIKYQPDQKPKIQEKPVDKMPSTKSIPEIMAAQKILAEKLDALVSSKEPGPQKPVESKPSPECKHIYRPMLITDYPKQQQESPSSKPRIEEFAKHVDDVINMTKYYQSEGLLSASAEDFLKSCETVKSKMESYKNQKANKIKLERLKEQIADLEKITSVVNDEELSSASIDKFLLKCKDFKNSLETDIKPPPTVGSIDKIINQIDETIEMSKEAKDEGLVSDSVDDFIRGCQEIRARIEANEEEEEEGPVPRLLDELGGNIEDIMNFIAKYRDEGLVSPSVDDFFKTCRITKAKIDYYKKHPPCEMQQDRELPICGGNCVCDKQDPDKDPCPICLEIAAKESKHDEVPKESLPSICKTCNEEENRPVSICESCHREPINETPTNSKASKCGKCKQNAKNLDTTNLDNMNTLLGYYEKNVRKITKIKRYLDAEGNIKENRETITIRKKRHDPNETMLTDDNNDDDIHSILNDVKRVAMCDVTQSEGFLRPVRNTKSDDLVQGAPMVGPILKNSVSADTLLSKLNQPELVHLDLKNEINSF